MGGIRNAFKDKRKVGVDVIIRDANDTEAALSKQGVSVPVTCSPVTLSVYSSIHFNDEKMLFAEKVGDVWANIHLSPEFEAMAASIPQNFP